MEVLSRPEWTARAAAHRDRLARYVSPHLARRKAGVKHPVHDFLFTYYSQRPAQLLRWHPGFGVALENAPEYAALRGYTAPAGRAGSARDEQIRVETSTVPATYVADQRVLVDTLLRLLRATAGRTPGLGCLGLHEWAMVYRLDPADVRHEWPLRLGSEATDAVVDSHRITCSHFDAYRFFTEPAVPLNTLRPGSQDRDAFEQPGCLHGTMDLYKHAFRLSPMISSDLVADCFELAWDVRILDMRAAPYDLSGLSLDPTGEPWTPVRIETPEGKRAYTETQRTFAERGAALRGRLIEECARLASAAAGHQPPTGAMESDRPSSSAGR